MAKGQLAGLYGRSSSERPGAGITRRTFLGAITTATAWVALSGPNRIRILELADGSYIMHPSLLLDPVIATAFLIGLPF
jgi:hypothetical protein